MNSNHCQLFTILIGFRTASPIPETAGKRPTVLSCNLNHKFSLIYL